MKSLFCILLPMIWVCVRSSDIPVQDLLMTGELAHGIKCAMGTPKGEDGIEYCPHITQKQLKTMNNTAKDLLLVTVPGRGKDVQQRFIRSTKVYNYTVKIIGESEKRLSEKVKLHHLSKYLFQLSEEDPLKLVLFIDGEDVLMSAGPLRIVEEYIQSGGGVLISSDSFCWPDRSIEAEYPKVEQGRRFLNAGAMVGTAEDLSAVLQESTTADESLQEFLTRLYIKKITRTKFRLHLDSRSSIFQNLHGATGDIEVRFDLARKDGYIQNNQYGSVPAVVRANEDTKRLLNTLSSYLAKSWNSEEGCRSCWDNMANFEKTKDEELPIIAIGVFIEKPTPFMEEFFTKISALNYNKKRIHLFVHNAIEYHSFLTDTWFKTVNDEYNSTKIMQDEKLKEWHAKNQAISFCKEKDCQYLFMVDSDVHLDNPFILKLLAEQNRTVVAPMLTRPYKAWSNFWGELTSDGFYARSMDYMEIVQNQRRGLWNVPYINSCYLLRRDLIDGNEISFINKLSDPDMAICHNLRKQGIFMHVTNRVDFGHLINADNYNIDRVNPDLWQMFDNRWDWELRYIHDNFTHYIEENTTVEMPCPDVYWFPLFKERFSVEIIEVMENLGSWSDGTNDDQRLEGGYESVPTIDIHMKQVSYEEEWLDILKVYVMPMQQKVYDGYFNDVGAPRAIMNFMVRYKPDEQPLLRPHHDTSTYTVNIAMNTPEKDYQGGGCRFIRYDCEVTDTRVGWLLMHPGRLTHLHEGLKVTNGTRYIVVSFIDP